MAEPLWQVRLREVNPGCLFHRPVNGRVMHEGEREVYTILCAPCMYSCSAQASLCEKVCRILTQPSSMHDVLDPCQSYPVSGCVGLGWLLLAGPVGCPTALAPCVGVKSLAGGDGHVGVHVDVHAEGEALGWMVVCGTELSTQAQSYS